MKVKNKHNIQINKSVIWKLIVFSDIILAYSLVALAILVNPWKFL